MKAAPLKQLFIRILVVIMIVGTWQGLGPVSGQVSASTAYTVTYDGNGNDGGNVPADLTSYAPGDLAIVHDNSNGLTKNGFIFGGWNTKADGTGTDYFPGQTFPMSSQNATLYAKWINPLTTWSDRSSTSSNLNDIAYRNGIFYAVGKSGLIVSSIDGTIWTKQTSVTAKDLYSIASENGKLIAVGANGTILVSANGEDWSYRPSGTSSALRGVAYGNGLYLAVGDGGTIVVSSNGSSWTPVASGTTDQLNDVVYANGKFIAVGKWGLIMTSSDGHEWTRIQNSPTVNDLYVVTVENGTIMAGGMLGTLLTSADGVSWTSRFGIYSEVNDIAYGNGMFVAVGSGFAEINYSANGTSWSTVTVDYSTRTGVAYGNGLFVAVGNTGIATSADGVNWTKYQHPNFNGIAYGNGKFVAAGASGGIFSSDNGSVWKKQTSNTTNSLRSIAHGNGLFVAVGDAGTILTSSDGTAWNVRTSPASSTLHGVAYGNGRFVAVGESGTVVYSDDGEDWKLSSTGLTDLDLHAVAYGLGQFAAVGSAGSDSSGNGMIYSSADGENWDNTIVTGVELFSIAASETLLVATGLSTDGDPVQNVYISGDGSNWSRSSSGAPQQMNGIAYDNGTYVLVGNGGAVRTSKDGSSYASVSSGISASAVLKAVAGGGGTFIAAGQSGAMVQSRKEAPVNYTIHFNEYGGDAKANPPFMMLMPGESIGALPVPPTRSGYIFAGWNTKPDGSGTALNESYVMEADTVAYAQWVMLPSVPVNLTGTSGDSEIALSWDPVTGAASYAVYQYEGTAAPSDPSQWVLVEDNVTATAYTVTGLTNGKTYAFAVKAFNAAGSSNYSAAVTLKAGGHGTIEDPYIISNAQRLSEVKQDLDAYYVLTNDIDLSNFGNWNPIGVTSWMAEPFTGHFDGKGHTISGLKAAENDSGYIGLFGIIGTGGVVQNLVISDVNISVNDGFDNTGALAGKLEGSAVNVRVTGGTVAGLSKVGGLVGSASSGAYIHASCTNVQVVGLATLAYVGGLAGQLEGAEVSESCSASEVSGGWYTGGLAGIIADSRIINSYAAGSVTGVDAVGGLIGGLSSSLDVEIPPSTLTNVYAAGKVGGDGATSLGGLIGRKFDEIHLNSAYYDKDQTGQSDTEEYSGIPLAHDEMGKEASFEGWDFDTIWHLDDRIGLPTFLRDDNTAPEMSGAKISDEAPDQVVVDFPEKMEADGAALARFSVSVNGSEVQITGKQFSGKELTLKLGQSIVYGQEVKVTYTDGDPAVTDKSQNRMASQTIQADNKVKSHVVIVSSVPADNETGVAVDQKLILTFNYPVAAMSGKYIYLMTDKGDLAEKIEANASNVQVDGTEVTITLSAPLLPLTGYHVLIDAGAFLQSADSVYGGISDPAAWNFITEAEPGAEWIPAGQTGFTEGAAKSPVLKAGADGTLYVLFRDEAQGGRATAMKLGENDPQWSLVGSAGFSPGAIGVPSLLAEDDMLYAAFGVVDQNNLASVHLMKYERNGSGDWTPAANPIEVDTINPDYLVDQDPAPFLLMHNGTVHIAYRDGTVSGGITVKKLSADGNWETVGNPGFSAGDIYDPSLAVLDDTLYAGYTDYMFDAGFGATVMKFNAVSGSWELVGNRGFTSDFAFDTTLVSDGKRLYAVYENDGKGARKASAMYFDPDEGEWAAVGGGSFSANQAYGITAAADNSGLYAAYQDEARNGRLTVMKYTGSGWVPAGTSGLTYEEGYNPSLIVHNGIPYMAFEDVASFGKLTVMKYGAFGLEPIYNSAISPETAKFNKTPGSKGYADVKTTVKLNGNVMTGILNGSTPLMPGTDYTVTDNKANRIMVTMKKEYLAELPAGTASLTFAFSAGAPQTLRITISENSEISPATAQFDKYKESPAYADVTTTLTLKSNTFSGIYNGSVRLEEGTDYTLDDNTVTIKKEYLAEQPLGTTELTFSFSAGDPQKLKIAITDSTPAEVPVLQSAEAGNAQVALRWSPAIGATGYKVYYSVTSAVYGTEAATVSGSVYSYTVTGLTNGVTYYFAVKSVKSGIDSDFSNVLSATPITVPSAPTNVAAVAGDRQATVTFTEPSDNGGSEITGYEVTVIPGGSVVYGTASPIVITGLNNGTRYTFTVRAINKAGSSDPSAASNAVVPFSPSSDEDDEPPEPESSTEDSVTILVNGKEEKAGTATTAARNGQTVMTIAIDPAKLDKKLAEEGRNAVVTIPVPSGADVASVELNGQMVKNMEDQMAILEIKTDRATYTLPAQQINIKAISEQLGAAVALQDIKIQVEIGTPAADMAKLVENAAEKGTFAIVVPPVEFTVRATYGETAIEVSKFDVYVERTIAIPEGADPNKITTGVVIEADGTVRHVPTKIMVIDGRSYAVINSLTNSTYTVVWNPREFTDLAAHWAKDIVNNMGSRMIIEGTGDGRFSPDRDITRAEFAAIIVRALGLGLEKGPSVFPDVKESDWFNSAIRTAYAYGLLGGFDDGTFRPNDKITREQAMVIISKAMAVTGLKDKLPGRSADATLRKYADAAQASGWAISSIADCVQAGIVSGRNGNQLAPQDTITRAEVAAMVQRLLQQSDLI